MEEQLRIIQYQLWVVMALFVLVLIANFVCYFSKRRENSEDDEIFSLLWEKNQLDELVAKSEKYLQKYPNNKDALYFGAKALVVKKEYSRAKDRLDKLLQIEPGLRSSLQQMLQEIDMLQNN